MHPTEIRPVTCKNCDVYQNDEVTIESVLILASKPFTSDSFLMDAIFMGISSLDIVVLQKLKTTVQKRRK